ncbi:uncharacterized protein [Chelonus insularis]|uniref:uncharacterized protein n=1 Tax=Chelonus insularis TaxID=460826 RepID=UPI00158C4392|nr:uncharacterized protein LOC118064344 [Chelonus insularis]
MFRIFISSIIPIIVVISSIDGIQVSDKIDLGPETKPLPRIDLTSNSCIDCSVIYKDGKKNFRSNIKGDEILRKGVTTKSRYPQNKPDSSCSGLDVTVINNIQLVLDNNESNIIPINQRNCQNNICAASATTTKDQQGNLVTTVNLKIITKMKDIKVHDVPVIDGVRGLYPLNNFNPNHKPNKPQIYRQNTNTFQPSFGVPKTYFSRPHTDSFYFYNRGISREESHGQSPWMTGRDTIDDKIEPPLSKTTTNDQQ